MNKINNLFISDACLQDIDFIINLILEGSRDGHFAAEYLNSKYLDGLKQQLTLTIEKKIMPTDRGLMKANLYLLQETQENNNNIGFSWIRYHKGDECEIYLFALTKNARSQGYGNELFKFLLSTIKANRIYVDLYKKSTYMKNIVIKNNFQFEKNNYGGAERYVKKIAFKSRKTVTAKQKNNILQKFLKIFKI